jgi:hypothetical protein
LLPRWLTLVALLSALACANSEPKIRGSRAAHRLESTRALRRLHRQEAELRLRTDPKTAPPGSRAFGPDPYRLCSAGTHSVGVLRGNSELTLLDSSLRELARVPAPSMPVDCAVSDAGELVVVGALSRTLSVYRLVAEHLLEVASVPLSSAARPRALTIRGRTLWLADEGNGSVSAFELSAQGIPSLRQSQPLCHGPIALAATARHLVAHCLLDHALVVHSLGANAALGPESARITHDGPFWAFTASENDGSLLLAATGVEDHPLERFDGAFGYVDSFLFLYRVNEGRVERLHALNLSDRSLLVPKALLLEQSGDRLSLWVAAYGSDGLGHFEFPSPDAPPGFQRFSFVPGVAALSRIGASLVAASPLLDAWARFQPESGVDVVPVRASSPLTPPSVRLGEALVFTEAIAPFATSEGKKSRFTCETCHFEGAIDGRVHHTGRGDVRVSTRPLFGLLRNAPHFSRALDPDLSSVSHNEFRVASLGNTYDPWFTLPAERYPWLRQLGVEGELGPERLRRAFVDFLARFEPEPNANAHARTAFSELEREGARLFEARCASCHAARLASDDPASEVPFSRWESLIFSEAGPIVWARGEYEKTGIVPYVHEQGARVASLRRITRKSPYFTDGSAHSLSDVLARSRLHEKRFFHGHAPADALALPLAEQRALASFLELL